MFLSITRSRVMWLAVILIFVWGCRTVNRQPQEPMLEAAPLGEQVGPWRVVTSETVKLTVKAPGAALVRLLYKPFASVGRYVELKSMAAQGNASDFSYDWKAGADMIGEVWAETSYQGGVNKKTQPIALAQEAAISEQTGEIPLDSVGGSINSDESARADKITGGRIGQTALKAGDRRIWLTVDAPAFRLTLWQAGKEVKTWQIGIGRKNFPLPIGPRKAMEIVWNPEWVPPNSEWVEESKEVEPGERIEADDPRNPLGKIKIRLGDGFLIHEAAKPSDIGHLVSHGCVRMLTADLYELTEMIAAARALPVTKEQVEQTKTSTERLAVKLNPPLWVDINYDLEVIEGKTLHLYPDVYRQGGDAVTRLRTELQEAGVPVQQLDEQTLKQMRERVNSVESYIVSLDEIKGGRALTAGRTEPLTDYSVKKKPGGGQ